MDWVKIKRWIITTGGIVLGGGIAGAFTAALDPTKYRFPHDFGSGKLWEYFGEGCALTFGGCILNSPWGRRIMSGFQQTQKEIQEAKDNLK